MDADHLIISGLVLDIIGALCLASAIFFVSSHKIVRQSTYNTSVINTAKVIREKLIEKIYVRVGLQFLITGFILQICGTLEIQAHPLGLFFAALVFLVLLAVVIGQHDKDKFDLAVLLLEHLRAGTQYNPAGLNVLDMYQALSIVKTGHRLPACSHDERTVNWISTENWIKRVDNAQKLRRHQSEIAFQQFLDSQFNCNDL